MKEPKHLIEHDIIRDGESVGYILLVSYYGRDDMPHLEYYIKPKYRNRKIMSNELPLFIKRLPEDTYKQLVALVELKNRHSINLLEKAGFTQGGVLNGKVTYIMHRDYDKEFMDGVVKMFWKKNEKSKKKVLTV